MPVQLEEQAPPTDAAPRRRRLHLSIILSELGREHDVVQPLPGAPAKKIRTDLTIGEIIDRAGAASFGFLVAMLTLLSLPIPGFSPIGGLAVSLGALQMIVGMQRPWLPGFVRRHRISLRTLRLISGKLVKWTSGLEKLVRPRFEFLTRGPLWSLCGACILIQALGLALPLPIPWSNSLFGIPIILYAIGLLEADGLLVMICHAITAVEIFLCIQFWEQIAKGLQALLHWFGM